MSIDLTQLIKPGQQVFFRNYHDDASGRAVSGVTKGRIKFSDDRYPRQCNGSDLGRIFFLNKSAVFNKMCDDIDKELEHHRGYIKALEKLREKFAKLRDKFA
jgi:hypothetical protein